MKDLFSGDWPAASALLGFALELPPEQREAWLESLSGEDIKHVATLRDFMARNTLLEENEFLARLPEFPAEHSELPDDDAPPPGARIGPYVLIKRLGRGGMSTVFLAGRPDGYIKREVALKVPHGQLLVPRMAERFARERDILAALTHPNIARLYDAGISEAGQPYLAMEYVDGTPLIEYCNDVRLAIAERLGLFQQVLAAVRHAHSKLVLPGCYEVLTNALCVAERPGALLAASKAYELAQQIYPDSSAKPLLFTRGQYARPRQYVPRGLLYRTRACPERGGRQGVRHPIVSRRRRHAQVDQWRPEVSNFFRDSVAALSKTVGPDFSQTRLARSAHALMLARLGRLDEAETEFDALNSKPPASLREAATTAAAAG